MLSRLGTASRSHGPSGLLGGLDLREGCGRSDHTGEATRPGPWG